MKSTVFVFLCLLLFGFSCVESQKERNLEDLEITGQEIQALSESVSCTNSAEWRFSAMGSKACGGPMRYIAYHVSVEDKILKLISNYTSLQAEYNQKYQIISDCALVSPPRNVICEGGKPFLVY
jgi:hypothetical protein